MKTFSIDSSLLAKYYTNMKFRQLLYIESIGKIEISMKYQCLLCLFALFDLVVTAFLLLPLDLAVAGAARGTTGPGSGAGDNLAVAV